MKIAYANPATRAFGAVDLAACPFERGCRCEPKCKVCGFGKHMAIHGPKLGCEPGREPYGHEFVPAKS